MIPGDLPHPAVQAETRSTARLLRAAGRGLRALARIVWPPEASLAFLAGIVVALELMGNSLATDRGDAIGVVFLATGLLVLAAWHRATPSRWMAAVGSARRALAARLATRRVTVGLDFRGDPPLPRAFPPLLRVALLASALAVTLAAAWPSLADGGLRELLAARSYSLYLLALGLVWLGVALAVIGALWVAHAALHDLYVSMHMERRPRPRGRETLATVGLLAAVLLGWVGLPAWLPLAGIAALAAGALAATLLPARGGLQLLWRSAAAGEEPGAIRAVPLRRAHAGELCASLLVLIALVLATRGGALLHAAPETARAMPVTCALGGLLSWAGIVGACGFNAPFLHQLAMRRTTSRQRATRRVHVDGALPSGRARELRRALRAKGWRLALGPKAPRKADVRVRLVDEAPEVDPWQPTRWPLAVAADELDSPS